MEDESTTILVIVVSLLILVVGVFAFYTVYNNIGYETRQTEYFTVSDPSNDVDVELSHFPESIVSVYQYNGFEWLEVDMSYVSVNFKDITIDKNGLQG